MSRALRRSSWIVTVPLAAAAVAYIFLLFLPTRRAISEIWQQIDQKQEYVDQAAGQLAALSTAQRGLEKARAYGKAWEEQAPNQERLSALFAQIGTLAKASGCNIHHFDPDPIVRRALICELPLNIGCTGSFAQVGNFLSSLEGLPLRIWINTCKIEKMNGSGESVTCSLDLVVFSNNPDSSDYVKQSN